MSVYDKDNKKNVNRIFISYSSIDRIRTTGLAMLLKAMGHQVFHDHDTILPGRRWKAALQEGLDDADAVMVFWTKHAARSDWVRKEYEYFLAKYPDRVLAPVLGDDTPLTALLETRQGADFIPVVNDVLQMKRDMKKDGKRATEIARAVEDRLKESGITVDSKHQKRALFLFLGFNWLLTLLRYPAAWLQKTGSKTVETSAQATAGQLVGVAVAAIVGGGLMVQPAIDYAQRDARKVVATLKGQNDKLQTELGFLREENSSLDERNEDLADRVESLVQADGRLEEMESRLGGLESKLSRLAPDGGVVACVSPTNLADSCTAGIDKTNQSFSAALDSISDTVAQLANEDTPGVSPFRLGPGEESMACTPTLIPVWQPEPMYPDDARSDNIEGAVLVRAKIDKAGKVVEAVPDTMAQERLAANAIRGSNSDWRFTNDEKLTDAAVGALERWRFTKCERADGAEFATYDVLFNFEIND